MLKHDTFEKKMDGKYICWGFFLFVNFIDNIS